MAFLLQKRRPLARSIAYTIGRGVTLTVASVIIVWTLIRTDSGVNGLADQVTSLARQAAPGHRRAARTCWSSGRAFFIYLRPPAFLSAKKPP